MDKLISSFSYVEQEPVEGREDWYAGLTRPSWLMNQIEADSWHLEIQVEGYAKSAYVVNWDVGDIHDDLLGRSRYWINTAKQVAYWYMESDATECNRTTSLAFVCRELLGLFMWLAFTRNVKNLQAVNEGDIRAYERHLASKKLSVSTVEGKLIVLRLPWVLRAEISGGFSFDPYMKSGSMRKAARRIGVVGKHTKTIKPRDLFIMIEEALAVTSETQLFFERFDLYLKLSQSTSDPAKRYKKQTGQSSLELFDQTRYVYSSAIFIILLLLGERKHELAATKYADVESLLELEVEELVGRVSKTSPTLSGRKTERPVVPELLAALEVVRRLTEFKRKEYNGDLFFIRHPFQHSASEDSRQLTLPTNVLYRMLDEFACRTQADVKKIRPHMMRRAFSMMWAWRYDVGDLHHLSKMLYHNNEMFTKAYTEDEDVFEFLPEELQSLMYEMMEESLLGGSQIGGIFSKTMNRYKRALQSVVNVITPEVASNFVRAIVGRHKYRIIPQVDGFCMMSDARAKYAKCSTDGKGPDYSNRDDSHCVTCQNFGVPSNRRPVWEERLAAHKKVSVSTDISTLRAAALDSAGRAEMVLKWVDAVTDD